MNPPVIYLHIGFHKTGTTSIQAFMASNAKVLRKNGVLYPESGRAGNSHAYLANALKSANMALDPDALYDGLRKEIAASDVERVVLSSECFMENVSPERVYERLMQTGCEVKVVVYIRRQDLWLQSLYNEVVRDPSRRYTGNIESMREVRIGMDDYYSVLELWAEQFGKANIIVRVLEKEQLVNGLYDDFLSVIGLEYDQSYLIPEDSETNIGFSDVLVLALRRLNYIAMKRDMYVRLVDALAELAKEPNYTKNRDYAFLSPVDARELVGKHEKGNRRIAQEYLSREDGRLFFSEIQDSAGVKYKLDAEVEKDIFDRLPLDIREHMIKMRPRLARPIIPNRPFFAPGPDNEMDRLRMVNQRMRLELNWLYEERDALVKSLQPAGPCYMKQE